MKVIHEAGLPSVVADAFEKYLPDVKRLLPSWLRELEIRWREDNPDNSILAVGCQHQYRRAWVVLYPPFLGRTPEDQLADVKHEIGHLHAWHIDQIVQDMLSHIKEKNPELADQLRKMYGRELEAFCEDFGHIM